jgi:hypothetical protein
MCIYIYIYIHIYNISISYCKELPNKDHTTCRKERFIGSTDCQADSLRVQSAAAQLEWVGGFIGGAAPQGGRVFLPENSWATGLHLTVITRWNGSMCIAS